ncbi:hypothetical protein RISINGSUN_174 [Erwinia phage vB_EamM_RisingSun]|uniref:Uncharacterized protein n=1 Tax=Erwinia phage vB_EamM_RisingSun TaxID=2026080 RepID=A0A223LIY1_9CAUD|nr:hypothetical protein FDI45_gp174 [Erwinia phage vB_EamM_RisingSun]ASU03496.1 hypothetical protein RISINGSUN_174 [Erwinia phage vB_EamM_RisingSun]
MLHVNLSMPQQTRFGHALLHFWYGSKSEEMRGLVISMTGYPHNGGEHSLTIGANPKDVIAWVQLFRDEFPYVDEEIQLLLKELEGKTTGKVNLIQVIRDNKESLLWQWVRCQDRFINPVDGNVDKKQFIRKHVAGQQQPFVGRPVRTEEAPDEIHCRKEDAPAVIEHIKQHGRVH